MAGDWIYAEEQKFRQWWVWLIILGAAAYAGTTIINLGRNDVLTILTFFLLVIGVPLLFLVLKLRTRVSSETIELEFSPIWTRLIRVSEVISAEAVTYRPIRDYGGWGIRYGLSKGWAYNVSGKHGVRLEIKGRKPLLIGSRRAEELAAAVNSVLAGNKGR